jgi:hypothetical protein
MVYKTLELDMCTPLRKKLFYGGFVLCHGSGPCVWPTSHTRIILGPKHLIFNLEQYHGLGNMSQNLKSQNRHRPRVTLDRSQLVN